MFDGHVLYTEKIHGTVMTHAPVSRSHKTRRETDKLTGSYRAPRHAMRRDGWSGHIILRITHINSMGKLTRYVRTQQSRQGKCVGGGRGEKERKGIGKGKCREKVNREKEKGEWLKVEEREIRSKS
jgi:hypothetical protein